MFSRSIGLFAKAARKKAETAATKIPTEKGPVASFVREALDKYPYIRSAQLGERMKILVRLWSKLSPDEKKDFYANPLRGIRK